MENLERQQKQTIERLEQEHTTRLRDEARRIKGDQDKELAKQQNALKNRKKEVSPAATPPPPPLRYGCPQQAPGAGDLHSDNPGRFNLAYSIFSV